MKEKTFFSSLQAQKEIENLYLQKLDALLISYEFLKIETSFCDTNIVLTGRKEGPPLVLLHGSNGCAPVAIEALIGLADYFRIYAIDVVGQPNLSAGCRPSMQDDTYGKWMYEILSRMNIRDAFLVGISFGGFIAWKSLIFDEKRFAKAFFIVPAGIVNGNPLKALWKVFRPMKLYMASKKTKYVQQFLDQLFTEPDRFAFTFLSQVFLHFTMDFSPIPLIKKEEAKRVKTPVTIIGAEKDLLFPGGKLLKRAEKIFPSLEKTLLLKKSKHVPGRADNDRIVALIKSSLNNHSK